MLAETRVRVAHVHRSRESTAVYNTF
jgi:hypothetical protein